MSDKWTQYWVMEHEERSACPCPRMTVASCRYATRPQLVGRSTRSTGKVPVACSGRFLFLAVSAERTVFYGHSGVLRPDVRRSSMRVRDRFRRIAAEVGGNGYGDAANVPGRVAA